MENKKETPKAQGELKRKLGLGAALAVAVGTTVSGHDGLLGAAPGSARGKGRQKGAHPQNAGGRMAGKHREGGRRFRCKGGTKTMIGNDVAHNTPSAVQQRCYTVDDLRVILNVSRSTVYQLLKRNEFRWFQIGGGKYRISKKSFDDWLDCQS